MALYFKETIIDHPVLMRDLGEGHPLEVFVTIGNHWIPTINQSTDELTPITEEQAKILKPLAF